MNKMLLLISLSGFLLACSDTTNKAELIQAAVPGQITGVVIPELPQHINFFGKNLPLDNEYMRERLDLELVINTHHHSATILGLKRAGKYFPDIEKILAEYGLPDDLKYLCLIESNLSQATSPSGAKGFWQFMPETAKKHGLCVNDCIDERLHIEKSTRAACEYLKGAYDEFGDWYLASAAYNRGVSGIRRDLKEQEVDNYFQLHLNKETSRYVFRMLAMKLIHENPGKFGFVMGDKDAYKPLSLKKVKVYKPVKDLVKFAQLHRTTLFEIKQLNPWIVGEEIPVKGDTLEVDLPVND